MLTYRVTTDNGIIAYQGTDKSEALKAAAALYETDWYDGGHELPGDIECRDVKECGHYGHSTWLWRKTVEQFLDDENLAALTNNDVPESIDGWSTDEYTF